MPLLNDYWGSSFTKLLRSHYQELLPRFETAPASGLVHGTTICAMRYAGGVVIGGDRRATADGHIIMSEDVTKVYKVDDHSAIAIAGAFGPSVKMARLFQVELEHYEKIEGSILSLDGKANRLSFRFARRVAITFEETKAYVPNRDVVWTGCPCNSERSAEHNLLSRFHLQPKRLTILVLGGSQGSRYLNEVFFEAVPYLQAERDIQVIAM